MAFRFVCAVRSLRSQIPRRWNSAPGTFELPIDSWNIVKLQEVPNGSLIVFNGKPCTLRSKAVVKKGRGSGAYTLNTTAFHVFDPPTAPPTVATVGVSTGLELPMTKTKGISAYVEEVDLENDVVICRGTHSSATLEVPISLLTPMAYQVLSMYDVQGAMARILTDDSDTVIKFSWTHALRMKTVEQKGTTYKLETGHTVTAPSTVRVPDPVFVDLNKQSFRWTDTENEEVIRTRNDKNIADAA
eukprot:TRINITY_DN2608_c0_g1_i1.p1 TRINITY_DN2608_c0_g1~~TRINITY_DN2608_c0_g1_i1.p1  ORF type:complete len:271 (-),score=16.08 TRINITY_DN2608_c0_g1_i1:72-803(-)